MSDHSKIEWCDATWNPVVGCSPISEGCEHCYAARMATRHMGNPMTRDKYAGVVKAGKWTGLITHHQAPMIPGRRKRVFVGSMTDLFHEALERDFLDMVFGKILFDHFIENSHRHTFLTLTKRPECMRDYLSGDPVALLLRWAEASHDVNLRLDGDEHFADVVRWQIERKGLDGLWPLPNFWPGVTAENQPRADERIPILLATPAAKRFVSVEPMLGPLDIVPYMGGNTYRCSCGWHRTEERLIPHGEQRRCLDCSKYAQRFDGLDWTIAGAETGPGARPMDLAWARAIRDQCRQASVPYFFKQAGPRGTPTPDDLMIREFP